MYRKAGIAVILISMITGLCLAYESPVGNPTAPPTSRRSGLIKSPNPMGTGSGNVVTGNVTGLKYFHDRVPYRSSYEFTGRLGTGHLNSFLRRSALPENYDYTGESAPYYSRSRSVSSLQPGGGFMRGQGRISDRVSDEPGSYYGEGMQPRRSGAAVSGLSGPLSSYARQQYLKQFGKGTEEDLSLRFRSGLYQGEEKEKKARAKEPRGLRSKSELFRDDRIPGRVDSAAKLEEQKSMEEFGLEDFGRIPGEQERDESDEQEGTQDERSQQRSPGREDTSDRVDETDMTGPGQKDSLSADKQIEREINNLNRSLFQEWEEPDAEKTDKEGVSRYGFTKTEKKATEPDPDPDVHRDRGWGDSKIGGDISSRLKDLKGSEEALKKLKDKDTAKRAKKLLDTYPDFETFCEDNYKQRVRLAKRFLEKGRYYRAADTYTLASAYKAGEAGIYAGKAHAMLAAGEYMSSSLFIRRALSSLGKSKDEKGIIRTGKIDKFASNLQLVDRDTLEERVAELEGILKSNDVPEIEFLLAYVYHQLGRRQMAVNMVASLSSKMPEDPGSEDNAGLAILEKAITSSGKPSSD